MTNQQQYEIFKQCVEDTGARFFCFCNGAKLLLAELEAAGLDPHIATQVARTRPLIAGMRGCCLSAEEVLEVAADILGIAAETSNPSPSGHNRREFFLDNQNGSGCLKGIQTSKEATMYIISALFRMACVFVAVFGAAGMASISLEFWEIDRAVSVPMGIAAFLLYVGALAVFAAPFLEGRRRSRLSR